MESKKWSPKRREYGLFLIRETLDGVWELHPLLARLSVMEENHSLHRSFVVLSCGVLVLEHAQLPRPLARTGCVIRH